MPTTKPLTKAQRDYARENHWRAYPSLYAEHMSEGRWVRYRWVSFVMERVRERVLEGNARIIVSVPPRHGKSLTLSHWFPSWYLDTYPENWAILASYGDRFAAKWGRSVRDHLRDHPESTVELNPEHATANDWATTKGGGMLSVGVGSGVTGRGDDEQLVDARLVQHTAIGDAVQRDSAGHAQST